ncbi:hypothetical protein Syun_014654 [Stephania yunnanensis]|uniref:Uncharacterized protein n=1 Tax=Stephania yunnanensis TaxID=152371 RepID=A0AAP0P9T9_9MAGN
MNLDTHLFSSSRRNEEREREREREREKRREWERERERIRKEKEREIGSADGGSRCTGEPASRPTRKGACEQQLRRDEAAAVAARRLELWRRRNSGDGATSTAAQ